MKQSITPMSVGCPQLNPRELIGRFYADEAVWQCYERKRELRRLLCPNSPLPEEVLDYLEWLEADKSAEMCGA